MEIDPHNIQKLLTKVRDQLRCPQCRKKVEVSMEALKVMGDNFAVMQLKCVVCDAHIMLHATVSGDGISVSLDEAAEGEVKGMNASSKLSADPNEVEKLRKSLEKSGGSFMQLFGEDSSSSA